MNMDYEAIISYFNYGILGIIVLGTLLGFLKGLFKSVYNLAVFVGLLLIGWLISPMVARAIINFDISSYGLDLGGTTVTSIGEYVMNLIASSVEGIDGALVEGTLAFELINSIMVMAVRLVFIIVWLILMSTLFKFIAWIVYLIIKPKRNADGTKKKKNFISRLSGMGVSLVHSLIFVLLLSIPLAGITSIGSSVVSLIPEDIDGSEVNYVVTTLAFSKDGIVLLDDGEDGVPDEIIEILTKYRDTYAGKISGLVKIQDRYFDEIIFDQIFSFKVNKTRVKLRNELQIVANIYGIIQKELAGQEIDSDTIANLDDEVLEDIIDKISKLKLITIAIPLAAEVAIKSDMLTDELGDIGSLVDLDQLLKDLKAIKYDEEIKVLGNAVIKALRLISKLDFEDEDFNYLGIDPDDIEAVTDALRQSELLDVLGDFALSFLLNMEETKDALAEIDLEVEDIDLTDVKLTEELYTLSRIFRALVEAGFTSTDLETIDLNAITDNDLNNIADAIFDSKLLSNNTKLIAGFIFNQLPEEYQDFIELTDINKQDIVSILGLGMILVKTGILDDDAEINPSDILTAENIEKIADYISKSDLLAGNIQGILNMLLEMVELPITLEFPEGMVWKGNTGKTEIKAILTVAVQIFEILDEDTGDFTFTKQQIDDLADAIVNSRVIMANVGNLLDYLMDVAGVNDFVTITIPEDIDWESEEGKTEFKALLSAVGIIMDSGLMESGDFNSLTDGTDDPEDDMIKDLAEALSNSRIIRENLSPIITQMLPDTFELILFDDPDDWTETELDALLRSAKIILSQGEDFDINIIIDLTEDQIDILVSSKIIVNNVVKLLEDYTKDADDTPAGSLNGVLFLPQGDVDYYGTSGELKRFLLAAQLILADTGGDFDNFDTINLGLLGGANQGTILASLIITETIISNIEKLMADGDMIKLHPDFDRSDPNYVEGTWEAELPFLIDGILVIVGEDGDIMNLNIDTDVLLEMEDEEIETIVLSQILSYSIVNFIIEESEKPAAILSLPSVLDPNSLEYDDSLWYGEDGEVVRLLKALKALGLDDFDASIDLSDLYAEARGDEPELILASKVIEATLIKKITDEATTGSLNGILIIPNGLVWEKTIVGGVVTDKGELRNFLVSIEILLNGDDFENAEFNINTILGSDQDTLLKSKIVEASIVNKIEEEMAVGGSLHDKLVKPDGFIDEDWYGEDGELRKFLKSIDLVLGGGDFETAEFNIDVILGPDQEDILDSRIVEASVIKQIKAESSLVIPDENDVATYYYFQDEELVWERTFSSGVMTDEGELRRFLRGIDIMLDGNDFATYSFTMDDMLTVDFSQILPSRVLEATIAKTITDLLAPGAALDGFIDTPVDGFHWYHHATSTNDVRNGTFELTTAPTYQYSDLLGFLIAIQKMDEAGLNFNNVDMATIKLTDSDDLSDALWNYSRVVRGSVPTLLNTVLDDAGIPPMILRFGDGPGEQPIHSQADVKDGIDLIKAIP